MAEIYQFGKFKDYSHLISALDPPIDIDKKYEEEVKPDICFCNNLMTPTQTCVTNNIMEGENVLFAGPSSSGKSTATLLTAFGSTAENIRFAFIVQDDYRAELLQNEFIRRNCFSVATVDDVSKDGGETGLIITISKLHKLIENTEYIESIKQFVFDNIDQLQDEVTGHEWETALIKLAEVRQSAQFLLTSTNFSNIYHFARWLTNLYSTTFHLILTDKRLFQTNFNISIPHDLSSIHLFNLSQSTNFSFYKDDYDKQMRQFMKLRDYKEVNQLAELCMSSFPSRLTVRESYLSDPKSNPIIVVTFSEEQCKNYAWQIGQFIGLIQVGVTRVVQEFSEDLNPDGDDFRLLNKLRTIALNGAACLYPGMPAICRNFVETLSNRSFIKVLVVTEEIAINSYYRGKTVIVSSCRKFDGNSYRFLTNYEFQRLMCLTQDMPGNFANVTLILDWKLDMESLCKIVWSQKAKFRSSLLKSPNPLDDRTIQRSFHTFLLRDEVISLRSESAALTAQLDSIPVIKQEEEQSDYYNAMKQQYVQLTGKLCEEATTLNTIVPYLNCGRLIKVEDETKDFGTAIVIQYEFNQVSKEYELYVALKITRDSMRDVHDFKRLVPPHPHENIPYGEQKLCLAVVKIVKIPLDCIKAVYTYRLRLPEDLQDNEHYLNVLLNRLDIDLKPVKFDDPRLNELRAKQEQLRSEIERNPLANCDFKLNNAYKERQELRKKLELNQKIITEYNRAPSTL